MRTLMMALLATAAFTGSTFGADKEVPAKADNKSCFCGEAADGKTTATVGGKTYNVCCAGCEAKAGKMDAKDAEEKFKAANAAKTEKPAH